MRGLLVTTAVLVVMSAGSARAATVITMSQAAAGDTATQTMYLDADNVRISSPDGDMIYRGDQGKVFTTDKAQHSYMEMSPETMQAMKARMDQAMARMRQQMASMPEAQRKQVEAMMAPGGMPGQQPSGAPQISYEKSGDARKIGKWDCTSYRVVVNGKPQADLCVAKLEDLGLTRDDLKPLSSLSAFMSKQRSQIGAPPPQMASADFDALKQAIGYDGFPVQTKQVSPTGQGQFESTLQSVEHKEIPAGNFDVPAGYTRREMSVPKSNGD
ncbi:MAG: hypothetical protein JWM91_1488 [Rhodospirillales bacterium]|nr:hypothetical protein [Rhodospirillales bacterium]